MSKNSFFFFTNLMKSLCFWIFTELQKHQNFIFCNFKFHKNQIITKNHEFDFEKWQIMNLAHFHDLKKHIFVFWGHDRYSISESYRRTSSPPGWVHNRMCKIQPISHLWLIANDNYDLGYGKGMAGLISTAANLLRWKAPSCAIQAGPPCRRGSVERIVTGRSSIISLQRSRVSDSSRSMASAV